MNSNMIGILLVLAVIILALIVFAGIVFIEGFPTERYRIVSKLSKNDLNDKSYVIQQYYKHSNKWKDWYGFSDTYGYSSVYYVYKDFKLKIDCWRYEGGSGSYCPYFYKPQDADKALKDIIEFKYKVDHVEEYEIVKEVTFKQTL